MLLILAALALSFSALPAHAVPITEPIVFDFEDGLQGWELRGSAQRVQTQVLGGEWAIFGDGRPVPPGPGEPVRDFGASLSREIDLGQFISFSLDQFFAGTDALGPDFIVAMIGPPTLPAAFELRRGTPVDVVGNHQTTLFDVSDFDAPGLLFLTWHRNRDDPAPDDPSALLGFIDNITFHPVPEPPSLVLLGLALGGFARLRRWQREG